ncbi:MAG TPA: ammonium transporter [Trueperaceae bacterium]|nr:ammonium transporter [Trueperaceae bacterium]
MARFARRAVSRVAVVLAAVALAGVAGAQEAIDTGDTAWMLTSTALVLLMTLPGLALFYGGLVRKKNVLATLLQTLAVASLMSVLWFAVGYSIAFSSNPNGGLDAFVGGLGKAFFSGISLDDTVGTIPELLFAVFQMTFAVITPALILGSLVERIRFSAVLWFTGLWVLVVYSPLAHWVWGGGFLAGAGVLDFAGGNVVHINAGVSALVAALVLGKRKDFGKTPIVPHNLVLTLTGTSLLWVGWFGFNAGSAGGANALAAVAMVNTQVATAVAALTWMFIEWAVHKRPTILGTTSGAVAGLVAVTPAAGFVEPVGAFLIGVLGAAGAYLAATKLKAALGYDDSLDVFGIHGVAGVIGAVLTGVFASPAVNPASADASLGAQVYGVLVTVAYAAVATGVLTQVIRFAFGLRVPEEHEEKGLDLALHGEALA